MTDQGLIRGKITDADVEKMRKRIGFPNPTLRKGILTAPWNTTASADAVRRWALSIGDDNPLFVDPAYGEATRWGGTIAPPGFEWSMGWDRSAEVSEQLATETRGALRGVQLYHSGAEYVFHTPIITGTELFKSEWVSEVADKTSKFAKRSVIVTNSNCYWDRDDIVYVTSSRWFVHAERRALEQGVDGGDKRTLEPHKYSAEELADIEAVYDREVVRGADTLFYEDVKIGQKLPTMVKGPLTVTDMINMHMGGGWLTYGNPPFRLAYENRKKLRGFYSQNEFNAWDTIQRVHWEQDLARSVGVPGIYDIGPMRYVMVCHYLTNLAGDDGWIRRIKYELRNFNFVGDTTWIDGEITAVTDDGELGPRIEVEVTGVNQRGEQNIKADATILLASRNRGPVVLPPAPPVTPHRSEK